MRGSVSGLVRTVWLAALWLLFVGKSEPAEYVAAGLCAVVALIADAVVQARTGTGLHLRLRWLAQLFEVPRAIAMGTGRLALLLVARLARLGRGGKMPARFRSLTFDMSENHAAVANSRALAVLLTNLSADVLVVDITGEPPEGRLIYHQLGRPSVPHIARRLGAAR